MRAIRPATARGRVLAALLLVAAAPAAAGPLGISLKGFAGAGYLLMSSETPVSNALGHQGDFGVGLSLSGGYFRKDRFTWMLAANYRGARGALFRGTSAVDQVGFRVGVQVLPGSPVPLSLYATRSFAEARSGEGDLTSTVNNRVTTFGAVTALRRRGLPGVTATLSRAISETTTPGGAGTFAGNTRLGLSVSQGVQAFDYSASYETNWSNGDFAELGYQSHFVNARVSAPVARNMVLSLADLYFLRVPTNDAPTNPRYDNNSFNANLIWLPTPRLSTNLLYGYNQYLLRAPGQPDREERGHGVSESATWEPRPGLFLGQSLAATFADARLGDVTSRGMGQSLGLTATLNRPISWGSASAGAAASVGLVEPETGGVRASFGGGLNGALTARFKRVDVMLAYAIGYSNGGTATRSTSVTQTLRAEASTPIGANAFLRGFLAAAGSRRDDSLFGAMMARSFAMTVDGRYRQHSMSLSAGLSDGLAAALQNPGFTDGLFLSPAYNTHRTFAAAQLATSLDTSRLGLRLLGNVGATEAPGRPPTVDAGITFTASYAIGKTVLSADNRLSYSHDGQFWFRQYLLQVRLSRDLEWGF